MNARSDGQVLLTALSALANPHRLRMLDLLHRKGRTYVSLLAREIGLSRPLVHMHLKRLEQAGLVTSQLELSEDGKALNWFEIAEFSIHLTPETITAAAPTLPATKTQPR